MSWDVLKYPHVTEKSMDDMDFQNKLQFIVDDEAGKSAVAEAILDRVLAARLSDA